MSGDVNKILRVYLGAQASLTAIVGSRIYCPRLPEGATLPALAFFVRGGISNPYTRALVSPSFQLDCWGQNPIEARSLYQALYDVFQGIGGYYNASIPVVVGATTYYILSAQEEVQGQDLQEIDPPNYHRVLSFFKIQMQIL